MRRPHQLVGGAGLRVRLFCFPYSGAGSSIFHTWPRTLPALVDVVPVELPGRGRRMQEAPLRDLDALVEDAAARIAPLTDVPFAFFGHSMGALLAFELARRMESRQEVGPVHLFVSGHAAPDVERATDPIHRLPDPEFVQRIRELQGTPEELLANREFRELLIPILRADFQVCETYSFRPREPLSCHISAFGGLGDPFVTRDALEAWSGQTSGSFSVRLFPGDHFFLNSATMPVLRAIAQDLVNVVGTPG